MEQNLFEAICKRCETAEWVMVKNIGKVWVKATNKNAVPDNLPKEDCPECVKEKRNDQTLKILQQVGFLPD